MFWKKLRFLGFVALNIRRLLVRRMEASTKYGKLDPAILYETVLRLVIAGLVRLMCVRNIVV